MQRHAKCFLCLRVLHVSFPCLPNGSQNQNSFLTLQGSILLADLLSGAKHIPSLFGEIQLTLLALLARKKIFDLLLQVMSHPIPVVIDINRPIHRWTVHQNILHSSLLLHFHCLSSVVYWAPVEASDHIFLTDLDVAFQTKRKMISVTIHEIKILMYERTHHTCTKFLWHQDVVDSGSITMRTSECVCLPFMPALKSGGNHEFLFPADFTEKFTSFVFQISSMMSNSSPEHEPTLQLPSPSMKR